MKSFLKYTWILAEELDENNPGVVFMFRKGQKHVVLAYLEKGTLCFFVLRDGVFKFNGDMAIKYAEPHLQFMMSEGYVEEVLGFDIVNESVVFQVLENNHLYSICDIRGVLFCSSEKRENTACISKALFRRTQKFLNKTQKASL